MAKAQNHKWLWLALLIASASSLNLLFCDKKAGVNDETGQSVTVQERPLYRAAVIDAVAERVYYVDWDTWYFSLMTVWPDTSMQHTAIYHAFFEWAVGDSTARRPFAWAYYSPLQFGERDKPPLSVETRVLQFKLMTGWEPPDSARFRLVIEETGGVLK